MPRGFLVKRSKRASLASYKVRADETDGGARPPPDVLESIRGSWTSTRETEQSGSGGEHAHGRHPEQSASSLHAELLERRLSSPAVAESFPMPTAVSSIERLLMSHAAPVPTYPAFHQCVKRAFMESKAKPKKPKVIRKLHFEDEVTTSPVLGLKIKKESPECRQAPSGRKKPLGEFICQLCKEEYPDPFSLAQHKCSRIVRVEYRCPECDKVFSCPANLASHRRWHKPRSGEAPMVKKPHEEKENASKVNQLQHQLSADSSPPPPHRSAPDSGLTHRAPPDFPSSRLPKCFEMLGSSDRLFQEEAEGSGSSCPAEGAEDVYQCHYCGKKFRRQAYLRKHLAAHETVTSYGHMETGQLAFPCHLCGAHFPSAEIRDKHRLWHAVRDDLLLSPAEQQIFSCKHCPSTFFSSPGLTRHINKTHPSENRQVMLLEMQVRPGC